MAQYNNIPETWPPQFEPAPSPTVENPVDNGDLSNHDFILQCINRTTARNNRTQGDDCENIPISNALDATNTGPQSPVRKRARNNLVWRNKNEGSGPIGILRTSNNKLLCKPVRNIHASGSHDMFENIWHDITIQNNSNNFAVQERWRGYLALPVDLSRENRLNYCSKINANWTARYAETPPPSSYLLDKIPGTKRVRILLNPDSHSTGEIVTQCPLQSPSLKENQVANYKKRPRAIQATKTQAERPSSVDLINDMKASLHSRAERKITRIATWNVNNGFDHLAIASIMAKQEIDILALQEPRISHSIKDDIWISTMRKELRKCKYEIITSQFSYLIFDEQTSGAALASIIRQTSKINGRLLSVTFKSNDIWEVHTVISLYAVTNAKSTKKYAASNKSRKATNTKLTKALEDEINYLQHTFGDAPITIVGDFQDTIHTDQRDNIGISGKKIHPNGPLQKALNLGFQSAYHKLYPNMQQVTRWNGSRSAGRHIDLQMINESAAALLASITVDNFESRNYITSDHLIVIADYNIEKVEQNVIDSYRTKINFRKIAGIKMKSNRKIIKCPLTSSDITHYCITFDDSQFLSCMVQDEKNMLEKWQHEASSAVMDDILTALESSMLELEQETMLEDSTFNDLYDSNTSKIQRKLVERNSLRRAQLDSIYNRFQSAIYQIASAVKIISFENKHVEALCMRQAMKIGKIKRYGDNIINLSVPTSQLRSALGDLKNAEATLRNLKHSSAITAPIHVQRNHQLQQSLQSLSKNAASFDNFTNAFSQISRNQEEFIEQELAVSRHRTLDPYSGRWNECKFSSDICNNLLSQTNNILKANDVKQRVGIKQLDQSAADDKYWTNIQHWWNGPDLASTASSPSIDINTPALADAIQNALIDIRKLKKQAMAVLVSNKDKTLIHNARMNQTRNISQKLNPKVMDEPEAHHVILNPADIHATSNLRCNNFQDCLDNTLLYHQNWMDRSGSKWEHHWFQTTTKYGHINGISFKFTGKPTDTDFERLVKQHQACPEHVKTAFQEAHSDDIASIMQPPRLPHRALDWLWHPSTDDTDWKTFVDNYWQAITAVPGKARYNGYTMAVIGRLPRRWIDLHLRMMKMMMILRIMPKKIKVQARVPIPKPKPGETRPLSLIHDDMCFLLGFLTKHFALKCEEIKLFPPTIRAYRQGMSTSFITLIDLALREDALSFGRYLALTAEDEEKFFDRVSLEVQLAVLYILGFPMEGLLEMKAEEMDNISVEIHTRHGQVIGKFLHGLKQGSPLSCLISNLVLIFKHRVWGLRDPLSLADDPNGHIMTTHNKIIDGDAPPLVSMEGFCDDNSKWNMGNGFDFSSMVRAIQWNIKLAGDLSMIFKIGRRGDKTIIELFNVNLEDIHLLPKAGFTSIAWDFKANRPTEEEVDCRVYLKRGLSLPSTKPESLSDAVWCMLVKGTSFKSERSLGIWRNQTGDTSESADKRAFLFGAKIDRLNLSSLKNDKTIKIAVNSLVVPVYQFGILENKCCPHVYDKMDVVLINKIRQAIGFAWCDAKQLLFVSEDKFGMGIRSVSVEMLKSICRELEIQLNDEDLIGKILRGRLEAFKDASLQHAGNRSIIPYDHITQGIRNFIMEAIRHIAHYGFYVRDMTDLRATYQIEAAIRLAQKGTLLKNFHHNTLGMHAFAGTGSRSGTTLGPGDSKLLWSTIYGRGHTLLNGYAQHSNIKLNFSSDQLQDILMEAMRLLHDDIQALHTVFEWSDSKLHSAQTNATSHTCLLADYQKSISNASNWIRFSALSCLKNSCTDDIVTEAENFHFMEGLLHLDRNQLLAKINSQFVHPNRLLLSDIEPLLQTGWPLLIATDGGSDKCGINHIQSIHARASASVVILHPPAISFEQYISSSEETQAHILNSNLLPWKARASSLPSRIGDHLIDNAHAECFALILMEEWLPQGIPVLLIMDSEAERDRYHHLRNLQNKTNRFLVRSLLAGVSKCLGSRLLSATQVHQSLDNNLRPLFASNIIEFCIHAKSWCYNQSGEESLWKLNQWAPGQLRTVWAIRSHQLDSAFRISPKNRYGSQLVPNRSFVSANQWADNVCNALMRFQRNAIILDDAPQIRKWCFPEVALGLTGPNFIITFNGACLDRCVSTAIEDACNQEFIRRLAQRPTQGLLIRLQNAVLLKPEMIGRHSYHRRFLEGKTKTHTRAMYTDAEYRKAIVYNYAIAEKWTEDMTKFRQTFKTATKTYKYLRCPFCVPKLLQRDNFIFHKHTSESSGLLGNSRHFCFYCLNERVTAVRQQMTQLLEDHLSILFKLASNWGRRGFATLLERATQALVELDRSAFHNASSKEAQYSKTSPPSFACFTTEDWIPFFESQSEQVESIAKAQFYQWPLVHHLGFIAANCYSLLEMSDGEYSPCDLIPLGIIPSVLHDVISQFAKEIGSRHSQDAKKEFMIQWQQIRAAALLRAISIAMVTGAQISDHKTTLLSALPDSLFQDAPMAYPRHDTKKIDSFPAIKQQTLPTQVQNESHDQFPCIGLTCSALFTSKTNLRPSLMHITGGTCRRCLTMAKAIDYTNAIESALGKDLNAFRIFYDSIVQLDTISVDNIADAISKIAPIPAPLLSVNLKRATKRNVYSIAIMNMIRLLAGTFEWHIASIPTSIDIVFNSTSMSTELPINPKWCRCENERRFFAVDSDTICAFCQGVSPFLSTCRRVLLATASSAEKVIAADSSPLVPVIKPSKNGSRNNSIKTKAHERANADTGILRDITNLSPQSPLFLASRPDDATILAITQVNNMLSNFVISYFFKLMAHHFHDILYQEFLFDFVKREGGWRQFVQYCRKEGNYTTFLEKISHQNSICIIPICADHHWTILVRRFIGCSWKIFFIDSLQQGSAQRFQDWKTLFSDTDLFAGEWIKTKIFQQTELECGARTCVHGVCFALSSKKSSDIINDVSRFKDLAVRSRLMVSHICKDGFWSHQRWLSRTIGNGDRVF